MCAYTPASYVPQYVQIRQDLARRIQDGHLRPGDRLPSVRDICRERGVSTITARRALLDLLNDGVVVRRGGLGMFVSGARRRARVLLAQIGFSEDAWRRNSGMFGQLVGGIAGAAWERNAILSVVPIDDAATAPEAIAKLVQDQPQDGVLLRTAGEVDAELVRSLDEQGIPFVSIKRRVADRMNACVLSDDRGGTFEATGHVLRLGHRRVALIVATSSTDAAADIETGFREAHLRAGVSVDEALIRRCPRALETVGRDEASAALDLRNPPTAIVTSSDLLAIGVYAALSERSLRVPYDVAVVGFDDQEFAAHLAPPLSTVRLSYYDLGHAAAQRLFDLLDARGAEGPHVVHVSLVPRASTSALASPSATSFGPRDRRAKSANGNSRRQPVEGRKHARP